MGYLIRDPCLKPGGAAGEGGGGGAMEPPQISDAWTTYCTHSVASRVQEQH